ncbi:hypothetical protein GTW93_21455, partial [Streptomyces sp. SID5789]|nr:hypothetical protein [Streptomyces sp. SID5789]
MSHDESRGGAGGWAGPVTRRGLLGGAVVVAAGAVAGAAPSALAAAGAP